MTQVGPLVEESKRGTNLALAVALAFEEALGKHYYVRIIVITLRL
jgi:hypothetical protein